MSAWTWLDELHAQHTPDRAPGRVPAPLLESAEEPFVNPVRVDEDLRRLAAMRARWDDLLGHLAMLVESVGLWRDMRFASFGHYCAERLGMGERTVQQRTALERKLYALPALREAMRSGRVSYEKARLVAAVADAGSLDAWIARAERSTCIALKRELEAAADAQTCARDEVDLRVPRKVGVLLADTFQAVREAEKRWLNPGECLVRVARHFIDTWKDAVPDRRTRAAKVLARDRGCCQVPGCSRAAAHAHHVDPRSRGGSDEAWNLVALCAVHHLRGVHGGFIRVWGRAPDTLVWELGLDDHGAPLEVFGAVAA